MEKEIALDIKEMGEKVRILGKELWPHEEHRCTAALLIMVGIYMKDGPKGTEAEELCNTLMALYNMATEGRLLETLQSKTDKDGD